MVSEKMDMDISTDMNGDIRFLFNSLSIAGIDLIRSQRMILFKTRTEAFALKEMTMLISGIEGPSKVLLRLRDIMTAWVKEFSRSHNTTRILFYYAGSTQEQLVRGTYTLHFELIMDDENIHPLRSKRY